MFNLITTDFFNDFWTVPSSEPKLKVIPSKEGATIKLGLPGVTKNEINMTTNDEILTIRVSQKEDGFFQSYERSFSIDGYDESVVANLADGVLAIELKRKEVKKVKKIEIL